MSVTFKTPKDTLLAIEAAGIKKSQYWWPHLLLQGFFAGAYIAFGAMLAIQVGGGYVGTSPGLKKFLYGAVFPVGLIAVILTGAELFTGNTMCLVVPALTKKIPWVKGLLYNWGVSYLGNLLGSLFVAYFLCYLPNIFSNPTWLASVQAVAKGKQFLNWGHVFLRAIGCNWLVCLAVWQAIASGDMAGKILAIWWPIMAFVALGYEHCVANMFFVPVGLMYGSEGDVGRFIYANLIPATLGNIIGGMAFMGIAYWWIYIWVRPEKKPKAAKPTEVKVEEPAKTDEKK